MPILNFSLWSILLVTLIVGFFYQAWFGPKSQVCHWDKNGSDLQSLSCKFSFRRYVKLQENILYLDSGHILIKLPMKFVAPILHSCMKVCLLIYRHTFYSVVLGCAALKNVWDEHGYDDTQSHSLKNEEVLKWIVVVELLCRSSH